MKKIIRKDDEAVSPVIAVILMVAITVVLAGVLYVWVSSFGTGGGTSLSISANVNDRTSYWKIEIVSVSGGSLSLSDTKFQLFTRAGTSAFTKTTANINPTSALTSGESAVYAVPSATGTPVYENATSGTGGPVNSASVAYPERWEGCYFAFVDSQNDNKVNSGDSIWVFKDWNEDDSDDVFTGFAFKILDGKNQDVLKKEF
jgi:flagellin-like protein